MGVRISELPETTGINKEDLLIVEDGQGTKKGTVQQLDEALGVSQLKEDLGDLSDIIFSDDISSGFYRKGYWDFLGDDDLYFAPNNEFISEGKIYHYITDIDYIYVKKPSNIRGRLVVVFDGKISEATTNEEIYVTVPKNANKFGVYVVSTLPVSDFEGIVIKTAKKIKPMIDLSRNSVSPTQMVLLPSSFSFIVQLIGI